MNFKDFYNFIKNKAPFSYILAILILAILIIITVFVVKEYRNFMNNIQITISAEEELARLEAEEQAKRDEELKKQWVALKEIEVTNTLKSLGLSRKKLDVPIIYQHPEFPAGCECIALTNMMNYYKFNLEKSTLIENYLEYSESDFVNYYVGSPYTSGMGGVMMCPAISNLFNKYITVNPGPFKGFDITKRNFEDLFAYIERGHPVQIWCSLGMGGLGEALSSFDNYILYENTHSVLLTGFDRENGIVYIADSIDGECYYSIDQIKEIYEAQNRQAFVMISQEELDKWISGQDWSYDDTIPKTDDEENED